MIEEDGTGATVCTVIDDREGSKHIVSSIVPKALVFFVKIFHFMNAQGESGPLCLIYQVPELTEKNFITMKCKV